MPLTLTPYRLFADTTLTSVAPRNIALFGGGARVDPLLTSATYDPREHGPYLLDAFRWIRDTMLGVEFSRLHLSRPRDALSENMELGKCWEIEGSMGHLAVQLPDVVAVTDVSVDHVPPHLLSRADVGRAPKGITIWALVNDTTARRFPESRSPALFAANFRTPSPIRLTDRFIKLKEFAFDIHSSLHHQFFAVDPIVATDQGGDSKEEAGLQHTETMTSSRGASALGLTTEARTPAAPPTPMFGRPDVRAWGSTFQTPHSETTIIPPPSTIKSKYPDTSSTKVTSPALSSSPAPFAEQRAKPRGKKNTGTPTSPRRHEEANARKMPTAATNSDDVIQIGDRLRVRYILFCKDEDGNFALIEIIVGDKTSLSGHSYRLVNKEVGKTHSFIMEEGLKTWKYRVRVSDKVNT
ncbi:hypothetical protein EYR36_003589 [Pleurotus pulmonarius]|nr:hypothetical protein EYR36_003579 [Pleurotus pulmonarius]KAF4563150.1 hypothetical protein EYR36_003589 [Pleurotus pulmonarius]